MSLSRWIRDYLFMPLAFSPIMGKKGKVATMCKATIVAMTLCGIWHGAGWTFPVWGLSHGLLIAGYYVARSLRRPARPGQPAQRSLFDTRLGAVVSVGLTWSIITPTWILFRATDLSQAARMLATFLTPWSHPSRTIGGLFMLKVAVLMCATWAAPIVAEYLARARERLVKAFGEQTLVPLYAARGLVAGALIAVAIIYVDSQSAFIYFQF